jgi:transposase
LKCGSLPAKADTKEQRSFYETTLQPLMEQAKSGKSVLLFLDASHFVMGCDFLGYIYGKVRRFIKTYSGRKRYNVLGALNFVSKKVTTVTNDTYITSIQICEMLRKVAQEYVGKPIYIILDNASYQKCELVKNLATQLGISLVFIPPYSPNLNLIERLWKFVKTELRTKYYDNFDLFQEKINSIINSTDKTNKDAMDKLITDKVQLFDVSNPISKMSFVCETASKKRLEDCWYFFSSSSIRLRRSVS